MEKMTQRDAVLVRDIQPFAVQDYEYLRYSNDRSVRDAFLAGVLHEPELYYRDIDAEEMSDRLEEIRALDVMVQAYEDPLVKRAYIPKIRELREKYELLLASVQGDDLGVLDASVRLYGKPKEVFFRYALRHTPEMIRRVDSVHGKDPHVRPVLEELSAHVGVIPHEEFPWDATRFLPPRPYTKSLSLEAEEIRRMFVESLVRYEVTDWFVVVDAPGERTTFNTNHAVQTIFIPSDADIALRKYPLTQERVEALIAHEIETHVLRRVHGGQGPLALLGVGLADYLRGEEGIATYREQMIDGTRHFAGGFGYLCVGWAYGLDGVPRTFRELFAIVYAYMVVSSLEHALEYQEDIEIVPLLERVQRRAWARCVRTFRGTSGVTAGACFTKDIVYLEGNIAIWQLLQEKPEWEQYFHVGKYDPANKEHCALLRELGLIPLF